MKNKWIFSIILMLCVLFSAVSLAFAVPQISIEANKDIANVGDNILITITITNTGPQNLTSVTVYAPLNGLTYLSHSTNTTKADYDPYTKIWNVGNLNMKSKMAGVKFVIINTTVPSNLAGKTLTLSAKYDTVKYNVTGTISEVPESDLPGTSSITVKINKTSTETGNNTGNSTGKNTSPSTTNTTKKTNITNALKNATSDTGVEALQNLNQPTQKNKKTYEVSNVTTSSSSDDSKTIYAIIGGIIIVILVAIGYFKGVIG